ncbi:hypothetical protein PHMEG_00038570, partial [Phytophthora megakarya]
RNNQFSNQFSNLSNNQFSNLSNNKSSNKPNNQYSDATLGRFHSLKGPTSFIELRDVGLADFQRRDRLARAAISRGLRGGRKSDDASKVCAMGTAHEMWESLVSDYTQRDFSYAVLLRRQLYQCSHQQDQSMADYLRTMTRLRQQLRSVGNEYAINDDEMARILLMGVAMTQRSLVEQFDLSTRQGNPPTLQQVTNALRSRDERDRMASGQEEDVVMSMNGGGRGNSLAGGRGGRGGRGGGKKPQIKCYHCKKPGHFKRDCYQYLNKKAKVQDEQSTVVRKEDGSKKKKKKNDDKRKVGLVDHMEILNAGESSSEDEGMVGMVLPTATKRDQSQWMLDTGTSTHVCVDREAFTTQKQSKMSFKVWNGQVTHGVMSGTVVIHTKNLAGCGSLGGYGGQWLADVQ